ncbi:GNAT family N-acetyltransferase [Saccharomonospora piscinae]|uniref:GNAT family N-acetyltransferase n=1 Tax=Saccharomonospora piscinae TaxID=687388 RepID=A0A1V9A1L7_SACPI|nr:GNAT family N-acyltransferase [Saccharomonospora piscinae]OQO90933.1 GNAT family N-acetyltransferase [Saccharomonospora piscinae]
MAHTTAPARTYTTSIAHTPEQVEAARRLRHRVFAGELGARLPATAEPGLDADPFDRHCDHLLATDDSTGEVVGTYRLLPPGRTAELYSATEFDLSPLAPLRRSLIEMGRSCVHPDHRDGGVITAMWSALARYALLSGHRYLAGSASVPLADGGYAAEQTWRLVRERNLSPRRWRVRPHLPWPVSEAPENGRACRAIGSGAAPDRRAVPPLLRGYLRLGAWVCGPPAHDPEFGVADFFVLLPFDRIDDHYLRHFLCGASR